MRLQATEFSEITHSNGLYAVITPFKVTKVTDFGTNRKRVFPISD